MDSITDDGIETVLVAEAVTTLLEAAEETEPVCSAREVAFPEEELEAPEEVEALRMVVVGVAAETETPEMEARAVEFERLRVMHWLTKAVVGELFSGRKKGRKGGNAQL
jgi:hypothetical protein